MFNKKQKDIDSLNKRCVELAQMLKEKDDDLRMQKHNNYVIMKENEKVRNENADLRDTLKRINQIMTSNQYNNTEVLKKKIIELSEATDNLYR